MSAKSTLDEAERRIIGGLTRWVAGTAEEWFDSYTDSGDQLEEGMDYQYRITQLGNENHDMITFRVERCDGYSRFPSGVLGVFTAEITVTREAEDHVQCSV